MWTRLAALGAVPARRASPQRAQRSAPSSGPAPAATSHPRISPIRRATAATAATAATPLDDSATQRPSTAVAASLRVASSHARCTVRLPSLDHCTHSTHHAPPLPCPSAPVHLLPCPPARPPTTSSAVAVADPRSPFCETNPVVGSRLLNVSVFLHALP